VPFASRGLPPTVEGIAPLCGAFTKEVLMTTRPVTLGNQSAIPVDEMDAANAFFSTFADASDERATKWRRDNYLIWRTGWNNVARRYQANFVCDHDEAIALVAKLCSCLHEWRSTGVYDDTNKILGTYTRGSYRECTKCGEKDVQITSRNNWSGD
jgi:hypothetical protein